MAVFYETTAVRKSSPYDSSGSPVKVVIEVADYSDPGVDIGTVLSVKEVM